MLWLDICIYVSLAITTYFGWSTGLIRAAFDLIVLGISIVLAGRLYPFLTGVLTFIPDPNIAKFAAFIIILIGAIIILGIIVRRFEKLHELLKKNLVNNVVGGIFGLLWGAVILGAMLDMWIVIYGGSIWNINASAAATFLSDGFRLALFLLPEEFTTAVNAYFR